MEILKQEIRAFAKERDWGKFHSPKNLAIGLSVEASELLEIFLWMTELESNNLSEKQLSKLKEEIGDVMIHLANLSDKFNIDPIECARDKIRINAAKYPAPVVKGSAKKYDEY